MLETGYKFRFDEKFQRLDQIEIFVDLKRLKQLSQKYIIPDLLIGVQ